MDDLKKDIKEFQKRTKELRRLEKELARETRSIKERLLAGAMVERGSHYAELRLLPGRNPASKNPDDYDLVMSRVS